MDDETLFFAIRLAKLGYYNGDPEQVLAAPVSMFVSIMEYEAFAIEYESEYIALNRSDK